MSSDVPRDLYAQLAAHGQEHVLQFWPSLTAAERADLVAQLTALDLDQLDMFFARTQGEFTVLVRHP